jgi:hypothetical protein
MLARQAFCHLACFQLPIETRFLRKQILKVSRKKIKIGKHTDPESM